MTRKYGPRLGWTLAALIIATLGSFSIAQPASASDLWVGGCHLYLTGDLTYVISEDVLNCDESAPAITLVGPAKLRLNGHTVSCQLATDESGAPVPSEGTIGIRLEGKGAVLVGGGKPPSPKNGSPENVVTGCERGVVLNGEGDHRVQGVTVTQSADGAFVVESDENTLIGNIVRQVLAWSNSETLEGSGFLISGDKNELLGNVASDNDSDDEAGFTVEGNENHLEDNISKDNVGYGYLVSGDQNALHDNVALKNEQHGFFVAGEGNGNVLNDNKSLENGDEPAEEVAASGFHVAGSGNKLEDNLAIRNGIYGIHVTESAAHTVVSRNIAFDNFGFVELDASGEPVGTGGDLVDENDGCGSNAWYKNIFGLRSASCIR
jgi:parallel beta-helix repeat protein